MKNEIQIDRIGRKPVILLGISGVALSTFLFGIARSFWFAVFARSLAGALSGNSAVVQSVVGEITDESNQAEAFPLMGLSWSLGCIIGPMIGYDLCLVISCIHYIFYVLTMLDCSEVTLRNQQRTTRQRLARCHSSRSIRIYSLASSLHS